MSALTVQQKLRILTRFKEVALDEEWGSDMQIKAENFWFEATGGWFNIIWENHTYLLKATTEEMFEYAENVVQTIIKEQGHEV